MEIIVIASITILIAFSFQSVFAVGTPIPLTNSPEAPSSEQIAVSGNNIYVVWGEGSFPNREILYQSSNNGGTDWDFQVLSSQGNSPKIAAVDNFVYVSWIESSKLFFAKSNDWGKNFNVVATFADECNGLTLEHNLAASGKNVHLVYFADCDSTPLYPDVWIVSSNNHGFSFEHAHKFGGINVDLQTAVTPRISAFGNNVYVTWDDITSGEDEIMLSASSDGGSSFVDPVEIVSGTYGTSNVFTISSSNDIAHVIWLGSESGILDNYIYHRVYDITDNSLGNINELMIQGRSDNPDIASLGDDVYAVWRTTDLGPLDGTYYIKSPDTGQTFPFVETFDHTSAKPKISVDGDIVTIMATNSLAQVIHTSSTDSGVPSSFGSQIVSENSETLNVEFYDFELSCGKLFAIYRKSIPTDLFFNSDVIDPSQICLTNTLHARGESYNIDSGGRIDTAGDRLPSVLNNDALFDTSNVGLVVTRQPSMSINEIVLDEQGNFIYEHDGTSTAPNDIWIIDEFDYTVTQGVLSSDATVKIIIQQDPHLTGPDEIAPHDIVMYLVVPFVLGITIAFGIYSIFRKR